MVCGAVHLLSLFSEISAPGRLAVDPSQPAQQTWPLPPLMPHAQPLRDPSRILLLHTWTSDGCLTPEYLHLLITACAVSLGTLKDGDLVFAVEILRDSLTRRMSR